LIKAQLSLHPLISFSKRKELHFFDRTKAYSQGITRYFEDFNFFDPRLVPNDEIHMFRSHNLRMPLFAEATPFYIASRDACERISKVIPDVKLVVLVRDPVLRAYSEWNMKKR
jgi:hypothetical protein